MAIDHLKAAIL